MEEINSITKDELVMSETVEGVKGGNGFVEPCYGSKESGPDVLEGT